MLFDGVDLVEEVDRLLHEVSASDLVHDLLLSDLLAFETILDVELSQGGDSNALVSESAVEQLCSFLESEASPLLQRLVTEQKVNMFLIKKARSLLERENFGLFESFGAEVLHFVDCKLECL